MSDTCEAKARELQDSLTSRGVVSFVHWDRSPWGVRIPLTADQSEYAPALYVLTEGTKMVMSREGQAWFGQLGNFGDVDSALTETMFEWTERAWNGGGTPDVADALLPLLRILRLGAVKVAEVDAQ